MGEPVFDQDFFVRLRQLVASIMRGFRDNAELGWVVLGLIVLFLIIQQLFLHLFIKIPGF